MKVKEGKVKKVIASKPNIEFIFFSEDRIRNGIKKLTKARSGSTQGRLDGFFKVLSTTSTTPKRKVQQDCWYKCRLCKYAASLKYLKLFFKSAIYIYFLLSLLQ